MIASSERPGFRFGIAALLAGGAVVGAGALLGVLLESALFGGSDDAVRRLCDQALIEWGLIKYGEVARLAISALSANTQEQPNG